MNLSPEIATQLLELDKHCAKMQERDRQKYEEELISSRNSSRIIKYLKIFHEQKFAPKNEHLDWNSVAKSRIIQQVFLISNSEQISSYEQIDAIMEGYIKFPVHGSTVWSHRSSKKVTKLG